MRTLARPIRQLTAVLLLLVAVALIWFLGILPLSAHFDRLRVCGARYGDGLIGRPYRARTVARAGGECGGSA